MIQQEKQKSKQNFKWEKWSLSNQTLPLYIETSVFVNISNTNYWRQPLVLSPETPKNIMSVK